MSLAHWSRRRRLALLASEALEAAERERVLTHVAVCPRCAAELDALRRVIALVESDPLRTAEPVVPMELLARKTLARLDEKATGPREVLALRWLFALPTTVAALGIALYVLAPKLTQRSPEPVRTVVAERVAMPEETLQRLERTVAREQAARYLSEAQDVLVTVAGTPVLCDRKHKTFDLSEETRRSRELLSRGALLLDMDSAGVRSARPVLEDVERMLRQVATLDPCVHPEDVDFIHKQLHDQQLLMKIGLMTRELQG